jgi:hypothetical protein
MILGRLPAAHNRNAQRHSMLDGPNLQRRREREARSYSLNCSHAEIK